MSLSLSQSGATTQVPAYALAALAGVARSDVGAQVKAMAAADRMQAEAARVMRPTAKLVETPAQIREEVMADRGVSRRDLIQLSAQARLEAEISIDTEACERLRQAHVRTQGAFVDLRV